MWCSVAAVHSSTRADSQAALSRMNEHEARPPSAMTDISANGGPPDSPVKNDTFRLLLAKAARLFERHEAGRRERFNVFSVLRSEHDEVNLHSGRPMDDVLARANAAIEAAHR